MNHSKCRYCGVELQSETATVCIACFGKATQKFPERIGRDGKVKKRRHHRGGPDLGATGFSPGGARLRYYPLKRYWTKRIEPHLADPELNRVLVHSFNRYTWGLRCRSFRPGMYPADFEYCDWRVEHRGPEPRFWKYVCAGACHWLANFELYLAMLAEPGREWRILTGHEHTTVWDGKTTLFDFNYYAFGIPAQECYEAAQGTVLEVGERLVHPG